MHSLEDFEKLKNKYIQQMVHEMVYESDISFKFLEEEGINELTFETLGWSCYQEDSRPNFLADDKANILFLTRIYSQNLDTAILNYWSKYRNIEEFYTDIFFSECYLVAILEYAEKFDKHFKIDRLVKPTLEFLQDKENVKMFFMFGGG